MKEKIKNFKFIDKKQALTFVLVGVLVGLVAAVIINILPQSTMANDLFTTAEETIGGIQTKVVKVILALIPLAIIILLACIMLTHNEKKISGYIQIIIIIIVAAVCVFLVANNVVIDFLKEWFNSNNAIS